MFIMVTPLCGGVFMVEPVIVSGAVAGAKVGGTIFTPFGKWTLIITSVFFAVLVVIGIFQSVEQKSLYPLFEQTILKIAGADSQLGSLVDRVEGSDRPLKPSSIVSKEFPPYIFFWCKIIFEVVTNLWFMYFFGWLLYLGFSSLNSSLVLRNIILTLVAYMVISMIVGMMMYNIALSGYCLPSDKVKNFGLQLSHSYPFSGSIKFFSHLFSKDLFFSVGSWMDSDLGRLIVDIPSSNVSVNVSGVAINGT
jgi:hypothetical protein